jgi:hypothetical protein
VRNNDLVWRVDGEIVSRAHYDAENLAALLAAEIRAEYLAGLGRPRVHPAEAHPWNLATRTCVRCGITEAGFHNVPRGVPCSKGRQAR